MMLLESLNTSLIMQIYMDGSFMELLCDYQVGVTVQ